MATADQSKKSQPEPAPTTPGRPKDSGSRQQTHQDQASQSGSPALDEKTTRRATTPAVPTKPASAK
jgi:hypothetical protein